ncbi:MAG: hypothetical protein AABN33_13110 [Acidobacteriota bacterium]
MVVGARLEEGEPSDVLDKRALALKKVAPLLLTFAAGLICYGMFFNRGLGLSVIGYSIAPAERVMQGEVPYRDFLFNYTPGTLWVNALLMKAFGATLMTTRIGLLAFKLITLMTLFYVARKLTSGWAALIPVALTLAWLGHQQIFNVYPDQYLVLFALAGLICMLNYDRTWSRSLAVGLRRSSRHCLHLQVQRRRSPGVIGRARDRDERSDDDSSNRPLSECDRGVPGWVRFSRSTARWVSRL